MFLIVVCRLCVTAPAVTAGFLFVFCVFSPWCPPSSLYVLCVLSYLVFPLLLRNAPAAHQPFHIYLVPATLRCRNISLHSVTMRVLSDFVILQWFLLNSFPSHFLSSCLIPLFLSLCVDLTFCSRPPLLLLFRSFNSVTLSKTSHPTISTFNSASPVSSLRVF